MLKVMNLKDKKQKRLADFADRIVKLLDKPDVQKNEPLVAVLDDLLGAVCALIGARQENYVGKKGKSDFGAIRNRAELIAKGTPKGSGNWMAGFHFNSAMFRISAVFDRLPKALACCEHGAAGRYLAKKGNQWNNQQAHAIRKEVLHLKHEALGVFKERRASLQDSLSAVDQLLHLAETLT